MTGRTQITNVRRNLSAYGIEIPTRLAGLAFEVTDTTDSSPEVALLYQCTEALELANVSLTSPFWRTAVLRVDESRSMLGPRVVDSEVIGTALSRTEPESALVYSAGGGSLSLEGTSLHGTTSTLLVEDSTIDVRALGTSTGVRGENATVVNVRRSTVRARDGSTSYGVDLGDTLGGSGPNASVIASSVISVDTVGQNGSTLALLLDNLNIVAVGNTVLVGGARFLEVGIRFQNSTLRERAENSSR